MRPQDLSVAQLVALADAHIKRFTGMIESAGHHVNVVECEKYLSIWQDVRYDAAKGFAGLELESQCEVTDAVTSGDYDYIWGAS